MRNDTILNLADCTEFRQKIEARPPAIVRGTLLLLLGFTASALVWAAVSKADLIATAGGVVRSIEEATRVQLVHGGKVSTVHFREGDRVRRGELLVRLATDALEVDFSRAAHAVAASEADVRRLKRLAAYIEGEVAGKERQAQVELEVATAQLVREERLQSERDERADTALRLAEEALDAATRERARARRLFNEGVISRGESDALERELRQSRIRKEAALALSREDPTAVELARQKVHAARQALAVAVQSGRTRLQEAELRMAAREAELEQRRKDLERLEHDLAQCTLQAPIDGIVTASEIQVGDVLPAGALVAVVAPEGELRFDALVSNEDIAGLHTGQETRIKLDAYPYQQYGTIAGRIAYIAPDATAQGGEGRLARSYEVRISLLESSFGRRFPVELGMTGTAEILRGEERLLTLAFQKLKDKVRP